MSNIQEGVWIVLNGPGGEIDRVFVPYIGSDSFIWRCFLAMKNTGWQLDAGNSIEVINGSKEID